MLRWLRRILRVRIIDELVGGRTIDGASMAMLTRSQRFAAVAFIRGRELEQ